MEPLSVIGLSVLIDVIALSCIDLLVRWAKRRRMQRWIAELDAARAELKARQEEA